MSSMRTPFDRPVTALCLAAALLLATAAAAAAGAAGYLTGPNAGEPLAIADAYVAANVEALGLTAGDFAGRAVSDRYRSAHNGVTHVYFLQRHAGIPVVGGLINVNVDGEGRVIHLGNRFVPDLAGGVNATAPAISAATAVRAAAAKLDLTTPALLVPVATPGGPTRAVVFAGGALSLEKIRVELRYLPDDPGARLTWELMLQPDDRHWWVFQVDAVSGVVLDRENRMLADSYRVYAWPAESPNHVAGGPLPPADGRQVVGSPGAPASSPGDPTASPAGWHLGAPDTSGNNVFAQTDLDANNVFDPVNEVRPVDPLFDFDFTLDLGSQPPSAYREAAVTNLFYWNNVIHDILYLYGFDEPSGNFQLTNFTGGGLPGDPVQADAQDGSGTNNANFGTPPDGQQPRMQMFEWLAPPKLTVDAPPSIAGDYAASAASFGTPLNAAGVGGEAVLVDDGGGAGTAGDGCEPIQNDVAGKVALIDRGTCEFGLKVLNAESAGAIAAVVMDNQAGPLVRMGPGASGGSVTISSLFIGQADGATIKGALPGVDVTLSAVGLDRDSDLDDGVIAHEYGHGVSNRLTGGPSQVGCLSNVQQGGEGWSDFIALALTAQPGGVGTDPRGIGTYLTFEDPPGPALGIRPFPYSTDMAIDPQTYGDLATGTLSVPHGVGSVWATTVWELYWALVDGVPELGLPGYGYRQDLYDLSAPLAGNQRALQLVLDGMKHQVCNPSFLDARDGILAGDLATFGGEHACHVWWAFAKRGMGVDAHDGFNTLQVLEGFGVPLECNQGGECISAPGFDGVESVGSATDGGCRLTVSWSPATDNCDSGGVTYSVYRSTDPGFTPAPGNLVASGITGTSYEDTRVDDGVEYHYVVRASDSLGNTDRNTFRRRETAVGALGAAGTFADDAGDTGSAGLTAGEPPPSWAVRAAGGVADSQVYATSASGNYPDASCLTLETDTLYLGPSPSLAFSSKWDVEPAWDGGIVEVATAAGGFNDWTKLDSLAYPGVMGGPLGDTTCPNPGLADGQPAFNGTSAGNYLAFPASLAGYEDQPVRLRFVFGSDGATNDLGWFIDDLAIDSVRQPAACTTVNRAPVAGDDEAETAAGTPVTVDLLANDSDPDGDPIAVDSVDDPANGTATDHGDGTVTYTPDAGFTGTDTFGYRVCDDRGLCDTATVTVTVSGGGNRPPDARPDHAVTREEKKVKIAVLVNDSDPDGDPLTVTAVGAPGNGTVKLKSNGIVHYRPNDDFVGTDRFTYTACDPGGLCDSAEVTVQVLADDDDEDDDDEEEDD